MSVRIFGHYVSLPLMLLMLAEAVIHVGAVYLAGTLRFLDLHFQIPSAFGTPGWLLPRALLFSFVMLTVMTAFGLYGSALHKYDREYHVRFLASFPAGRSEEHTSELQSYVNLVCRLLLEKKNTPHPAAPTLAVVVVSRHLGCGHRRLAEPSAAAALHRRVSCPPRLACPGVRCVARPREGC